MVQQNPKFRPKWPNKGPTWAQHRSTAVENKCEDIKTGEKGRAKQQTNPKMRATKTTAIQQEHGNLKIWRPCFKVPITFSTTWRIHHCNLVTFFVLPSFARLCICSPVILPSDKAWPFSKIQPSKKAHFNHLIVTTSECHDTIYGYSEYLWMRRFFQVNGGPGGDGAGD